MHYQSKKRNKKKIFLWVCLILLLGVAGYFAVVKFELEKPSFYFTPEHRILGKNTSFKITCEDRRSGLKEVQVELIQDNLFIPLIQKKYHRGMHLTEESLVVESNSLGLKEGPSLLRIIIQDYSWMPWKNKKIDEVKVIVDTRPPNISVLSRFHYINQGGAGLIIYQTSEDLEKTGIEVGDNWFSGYRIDNQKYLSFFSVPFNANDQTAAILTSVDLAGNQTRTFFSYTIKSRKFRSVELDISDDFLRKIMPYFADRGSFFTGDSVENFLKVNRDLRRENYETILQICKHTTDEILWSGPFLRLQNSTTMAHFGDRRHYFYRGIEIDLQPHLGVDLASFKKSPVGAANRGKVVYADELGIFGKMVLMDHGCGLFSMYGHLNQIDVQAGQIVEKGNNIGTTGTTGLANGDHLHFAILFSGVFVNPIEWWDSHWIQDNVDRKLVILKKSDVS